MLNSVEIRNYKNLKHLKIESLGRINLITGKNNTGKSTLLEAISIYSSRADVNWLYQILEERGEIFRSRNELTSKEAIESNIKSISSIFSDRRVGFENYNSVFVGIIEDTLFGKTPSTEKSIQIRFVRFIEETLNQSDSSDENRVLRRKRTILDSNSPNDKLFDFQIGLEVRSGKDSTVFSLETLHRLNRIGYINRFVSEIDNFQFIRTKNIDREINAKLWDDIALTKKEEYVIQALRIIEPNLDRIAFISDGDSGRRRIPVIKLKNSEEIVPFKSMGDGINRILTIILGLVNSEKGYFLIDEFENGLHYSVQENLWSLVFELSHVLNIQVFATTHSSDCIASYYAALRKRQSTNGKLIRLEMEKNEINSVVFDQNELRIATENFIETR